MSTGTLIDTPPLPQAEVNDYVAVERSGTEWTGCVRALSGNDGALVQWDNGHQGVLLWSEQWRKLAAPAGRGAGAAYPTCDNGAAVTVELSRIVPFALNPRDFARLADGTVDPDQHGLRELAESLRHEGQQLPIKVRPLGDGKFGLVDGERRYHAATLAGFTELRVEVSDCSDAEALIATISASSHAEAYPLLDQARAVRFALAQDLTQERIARVLKAKQPDVSVLKRVGQLPGPVQELVRHGKLKLGHLRSLVRDHLIRVPKAVVWIAEHAAATGATVRQMECEIPFEAEMPRDLMKQLRPQSALEVATESQQPEPADPAPAPHPLIGTRFRWTDEMSFRGRVGTLTGVDVEGLATIEAEDSFTPDLVFIHVDQLEAKGFRRADPVPVAVAPEPASGTLSPALAEYVETLRGLSNPALLRQYAAQYGGEDPFLFDAVEGEIEERIAGGEAFLLCDRHSLYEPCPKCSTEAAAAVPGPAESVEAEIARYRQQLAQQAQFQGHTLGAWKVDDTHHFAKCLGCTGTAAIFTNTTPLGTSLSKSLRERCEGAASRSDAAPTSPTAQELASYRNELRGMPLKSVIRDYASYRDCLYPDSHRWRTEAARFELDRRRDDGVDDEFLLYCATHDDYACRTCAAEENAAAAPGPAERIERMAVAAGTPELTEPLQVQAGVRPDAGLPSSTSPASDPPRGYDRDQKLVWHQGRTAAILDQPFGPPDELALEWVAGWESVREAPELWREAGELAAAERLASAATDGSAATFESRMLTPDEKADCARMATEIQQETATIREAERPAAPAGEPAAPVDQLAVAHPEPARLKLSKRPGAPEGAPGCMISIPTDCRDWLASTGLNVRDYLYRLKTAAYAQGLDATAILAQLES